MNKIYSLLILCITFTACQNTEQAKDRSLNFDSDWKFHLGDIPEAIRSEYDDSKWRKLNLPHDWSIEGDFSESNPAGFGGGALPGGMKNKKGKKYL
jgi:beta-galactosidase